MHTSAITTDQRWRMVLFRGAGFSGAAAAEEEGRGGVEATSAATASPRTICLNSFPPMCSLHLSPTEIYPVQNWSLEMPWEPGSRPQPQYWIKFLDPCVHDFYPVLGWGLAIS